MMAVVFLVRAHGVSSALTFEEALVRQLKVQASHKKAKGSSEVMMRPSATDTCVFAFTSKVLTQS
jgi:hypothetical protein